ncbi:MAG: hypothetical protein AB7D37_04575 [Desulfovibrio sp.]
MSKLEVILTVILVCLIGGTGWVFYQKKVKGMNNPPVKIKVPILAKETPPPATEKRPDPSEGVRVSDKCVRLINKGKKFADYCDEFDKTKEEWFRNRTNKIIQGARARQKISPAELERREIEDKKFFDTAEKCKKFFIETKKVQESGHLLRAGRFKEAERLCVEYTEAIQSGF